VRQLVAGDAGGSTAILVERAAVTGDFFSTLGVSLRAGRTFSSQDSPAARAFFDAPVGLLTGEGRKQ